MINVLAIIGGIVGIAAIIGLISFGVLWFLASGMRD